jgi:adenylate cyclase
VSVRGYSRLRSAALRRAGEEPSSSLADFTAELLGLGDRNTEDEPHIPLEPDDERATTRRRRRR